MEWRRPETPIPEIARRVCAPGELATLCGLPPADHLEAFYTCWTRKEALIKAEGSGMTASLDRFEVSLDPDQPARVLQVHGDREAAAEWAVRDLDLGPGYAGALAVHATDCSVTLLEWDG